VNVVDSSGWLEFFGNGPNAAEFAKPLGDPLALVVPTLTLYEVFKRTMQLAGEDAALQALAGMMQGQVVDLTAEIAIEAARLSLDTGLAMADSVILATARSRGAVLWTQDAHFAGLDDVEYRPKRITP
jgi:predicted nucleic acid-binding protein